MPEQTPGLSEGAPALALIALQDRKGGVPAEPVIDEGEEDLDVFGRDAAEALAPVQYQPGEVAEVVVVEPFQADVEVLGIRRVVVCKRGEDRPVGPSRTRTEQSRALRGGFFQDRHVPFG
jgi:hypothetical protein